MHLLIQMASFWIHRDQHKLKCCVLLWGTTCSYLPTLWSHVECNEMPNCSNVSSFLGNWNTSSFVMWFSLQHRTSLLNSLIDLGSVSSNTYLGLLGCTVTFTCAYRLCYCVCHLVVIVICWRLHFSSKWLVIILVSPDFWWISGEVILQR